MPVELDEVDRHILNVLQEDARSSFASIARELNVSEATIRFRVKKLTKKGVITRFIALLDPKKIGLSVTATIRAKVDPTLLEEAFEKLASFEEAHHIFQSTGQYDIIAVVHARNLGHLEKLRKRVKMVPGVEDAS
ncbi:MAG: Lrp/AsnC family transcriptional regulator, partial [Candidatus Korarchaeota archaeon]|nr:Lrp/AsnC family transcriptional regulator [Candidatus Korarchaeota archaeon]